VREFWLRVFLVLNLLSCGLGVVMWDGAWGVLADAGIGLFERVLFFVLMGVGVVGSMVFLVLVLFARPVPVPVVAPVVQSRPVVERPSSDEEREISWKIGEVQRHIPVPASASVVAERPVPVPASVVAPVMQSRPVVSLPPIVPLFEEREVEVEEVVERVVPEKPRVWSYDDDADNPYREGY
jgi:hypothetical protein